MLEGRFAAFLTDRIAEKAASLPMSATQQEIVLMVSELQTVVGAIFDSKDGGKRRSGTRRSSSSSVRLSRGGGEA
ncbi:hypothetical protein [Alicyclobacillus sp. ALC3]|uniref:hypothetical protein n=1 Tax=Alicyclobacillus sp. ALC3 TaxID=2796143 RepID=UPI002379AA4F|nr:hypothetical protein [Alicyclobacillus sp. ALC3]WDL96966.1 hypothetical protein JC200_22250 [Alicyclobacillus sp. ALC3]